MDIITPKSISDIMPIWLTAVLRSSKTITSANVIACKVNPIAEGVGFVGQLYRITISYDILEADAPTSLVAKLPSTDPQNARYWGKPGQNAYQKETDFYKNIASTIALRTPRCFFGDTAWESRRSTLLLEDLSNARAGDQLQGCSASDAETVVRDWAQFNATFWENNRLRQMARLPDFMAGFDSLQARFDKAWPDYRDQFRTELPASLMQIGDHLLGDGGKAIRKRLSFRPNTLCHGDLRLDNLFFEDKMSRTVVIDWAGYRRGPGVWDISHFISQGLEPDVRSSCEHSLIQTYHKTLVAHGVLDYTFDQCWYDYRLSMLTQLQKLVRGFASFAIVNERHQKLIHVLRRRVSAAIVDNYGEDLIKP